MDNRMDIVFLPTHSWTKCEAEGFRTRDAHLLLEFEKSPLIRRILVVDRPTSLAEILGKGRYWRPKSGQLVYRKGRVFLIRISDRIYVLDIVSLGLLRPMIQRQRWWYRQFKRPYVITAIHGALTYLDFHNHVLFLANPLNLGAVGKIGERMLVFDATDNLLKHAYMKNVKIEVERGYELLRRKADIIFANSEPLTSFMNEGRTDVFCVRNGVNLEIFNRNLSGHIPYDIQPIHRPIIGYAGKINKRLDIGLLEFVVGEVPEASFVFIGQMMDYRWFKPLLKFSNVYYLGDKHYSMLPAYLSAFDICSVPHNVGINEHDGDIIKAYEYLAIGKPVVSTGVVGIDSFKHLIFVAQTKEEFLSGVRKYLQMGREEREEMSRRIRDSIPYSWTWESRANRIIDYIREYKNRKEISL